MQQLPGFKNLVALQFFSIRANDRSVSLQIENLTFAADTISHVPELKLKYLALESHMAKIERKHDPSKKKLLGHGKELKKKKRVQTVNGKGKGKAEEMVSSSLDDSSGSDDATENADIMNLEVRLRFEEDFWEVADHIKIFKREIRTGKLHI